MNTQFTCIDVGYPVPNPTISSIRLNIDTTVMPNKPTVIASFDGPVTGRKFDIDVSIVKI